MTVVEWRESALLWAGDLTTVSRPNLLEIRQDDFIPTFLGAMASPDPRPFLEKHVMDGGDLLKLYQPLHECYYLVTASLVCRQLGLPDKTIHKADGESIYFVIRRVHDGEEDAWIENDAGGYWQPIAATHRQMVLPDEETFPLHPAPMCPEPETPQSPFTDHIERQLHYGYIATGNRKKYQATVRQQSTQSSAADAVSDYITEIEAAYGSQGYNFKEEIFMRRVYLPWQQMLQTPPDAIGSLQPASNEQIYLYTLLELGDFFKTMVPTLWKKILNRSHSVPTSMQDFYDEYLDNVDDYSVDVNGAEHTLRYALNRLRDDLDLVRGIGDEPTTIYRINNTFSASELNTFRTWLLTILPDESQPMDLPGGEDSEVARLVRDQVRPQNNKEQEYIIRAMYDYDPDCPPIVSQPSPVFTLAKLFDPEAPARLIQIEAPSVKLKDMRRYSRGVGISMSPELHKLASCMKGGDMDGVMDSLKSTCNDGFDIQMVCTFSIQIIFMVAFIVMFIFLIALNFIFWWLAFLRICLPIPTRE